MDYVKLKKQFMKTNGTLAEFARKNGIDPNNSQFRKNTRGWAKERSAAQGEIHQKTIKKTIEKIADKKSDMNAQIIDRAMTIALALMEPLERACGELSQATVITKDRRIIEKQGEQGTTKNIKQTARAANVSCVVDTKRAKEIAGSLREIMAIAGAGDSTGAVQLVANVAKLGGADCEIEIEKAEKSEES